MNALLASFAVRGEHASWQQLCVMEKTTALTEMTKTIAVSRLFFYKGLGFGLHSHTTQKIVPSQNNAFRPHFQSQCVGREVWCPNSRCVRWTPDQAILVRDLAEDTV